MSSAFLLFVVVVVPGAILAQSASNDLCRNRIPVAIGGVVQGTTEDATIDVASSCPIDDGPSANVTAPGVWYSVIGNGNQLQATTCTAIDSEASAAYDSKISVYCQGCETLTCVKGNDDNCVANLSEVHWCSQEGVEYQVLVHGYQNGTGEFSLAINDLGSCTEAPSDCLFVNDLVTPSIRAAYGRNVFCTATNVTDAEITLDALTIFKSNGSVATSVSGVTIPPHGVQRIGGDFSTHQDYHCEATYAGLTDGEEVLLRIEVISSNNAASGANN
jgi:hypothetical protein